MGICILGWRSVTYHYWVTVTLTSDLVLEDNCGRSISLILFEIGIQNLVCECSLGRWSVLYLLRVTVTLTSDLGFRKLFPENISYIIKGRNPKLGVWMQLWMAQCHIPFLGHFDLDL